MKQTDAKKIDLIFIITYGLLISLLYWRLPFFTDDLSYAGTLSSADGFGTGAWPLYKVFNALGFHWLHVNGRFANYIATLVLPIKPQWILAVLIGAIDAMMIYGILKITGIWAWKKNVTATAAVTGICFFTFQWWDVIVADCNICYVWSTTFGLLFYILLTTNKEAGGFRKFLLLAFSLIAGGMHESVGAPICGAILLYYLFSEDRSKVTVLQKQMFLLFAIGTLMVITSPAAWSRAGNPGEPDDTILWLLIKSEPIMLIAIVVFGILTILPTTRKKTISMLRHECGFWMLAALLSTVFVCLGGKVGRAGWFAQTASLMALILAANRFNPSISRITGGIISALIYISMSCMGIMTARLCFKAAAPDLAMREEIRHTGKTMLFHDLARYEDNPWWTLGRVRVMRCYDEYSRYLLQCYYHLPSIPKILPRDAEKIDFAHFRGRQEAPFPEKEFIGVTGYRMKDGSFITDRLPDGFVPSEGESWYTHDTSVFEKDGHRYYAVEFEMDGHTFHHIVKWVPEPGDR